MKNLDYQPHVHASAREADEYHRLSAPDIASPFSANRPKARKNERMRSDSASSCVPRTGIRKKRQNIFSTEAKGRGTLIWRGNINVNNPADP
ncbi:hypothetical protein ACH95_14660 [Bacillus glycinifermentans]|uniref:Uncharacterized protein n=1 Tax=Bacillus glycinifermentans TaxID=1664069 RepID=A0A0J6EWB4_9BACI|nr:hypothetical protein ACH95_14660 [Bacillus glycinifermentans]KRT93204.1 hypothetical protein AB447_219855 [Bacillus glycinifermentans]